MRKIMDSVSRGKPEVSRQRLWQLRQKRNRRCITCGKPATRANHCEEHARAAADSALRCYHRKQAAKKNLVTRAGLWIVFPSPLVAVSQGALTRIAAKTR